MFRPFGLIVVLGALCACEKENTINLATGEAPALVQFALVEGGPNPAPIELTLKNTGSCEMDFAAAALGASWLSVTPTSGLVAAGGSSVLSVAVDAVGADFTPGVHTGSIELTAKCTLNDRPAVGSPYLVAVNVVVQPALAKLELDGGYLGLDLVSPTQGWVRSETSFPAAGTDSSHYAFADGYLVAWPPSALPARYDPYLDQWQTFDAGVGSASAADALIEVGKSVFFLAAQGTTLSVTKYRPRTGEVSSPTTVAGVSVPTTPAAELKTPVSVGSSVYLVLGQKLWHVDLQTDPPAGTEIAVTDASGNTYTPLEILGRSGRFYVVRMVGSDGAVVDLPTGNVQRRAISRTLHLLCVTALPASSFAWTGREMLALGCETPNRAGAYDEQRNEWSPIPPPPSGVVRSGLVGLWTGKEYFVWGGSEAEVTPSSMTQFVNAGAFYDPAARTWRSAAPATFAPAPGSSMGFLVHGGRMVWTGTSVLWFDSVQVAHYR